MPLNRPPRPPGSSSRNLSRDAQRGPKSPRRPGQDGASGQGQGGDSRKHRAPVAPPRPGRVAQTSAGAGVRRGTVRLPADVAHSIRAGHPWVYRDALGGRPLSLPAGESVDLLSTTGDFVARGYFDPIGAVAVRVVTRVPSEMLDSALIDRRVTAAIALRTALLPSDVEIYRLVHGEGDGLPGIVVDRVGDHLLVQLYTASAERLLAPLCDALERAVSPKSIYLQRRYQSLGGEAPRGPAEHYRGEIAPIEIVVREGALRFSCDVTAPLSVGLFSDLREGRALVGKLAKDRRVLNLFSYTGAFSLYAAQGGAREVVSVDLSARSLARGRKNFELSGLEAEKYEHLAADAFKTLAKFADRKRQFDLIVLDPPSFASGEGRVFSVARDYGELVHAALTVCAPGALLVCASNTQKVDLAEFERSIAHGGSLAKRDLAVIARRGLPVDFPVVPGFLEGNYLKFLVLSVQ